MDKVQVIKDAITRGDSFAQIGKLTLELMGVARPKPQASVLKLFYDTETTGLSAYKNGIHQLSGILELNGVEVERFNWNMKPPFNDLIDPKAIAVSGKTMEQINNSPHSVEIYEKFIGMLNTYIEPYRKQTPSKIKAIPIAFNAKFDDEFLRQWFIKHGNRYFNSYFWTPYQCAMVIAAEALEDRRASMENFKLGTVADALGIVVDPSLLHDAMYDTILLREIYRKVTGK